MDSATFRFSHLDGNEAVRDRLFKELADLGPVDIYLVSTAMGPNDVEIVVQWERRASGGPALKGRGWGFS